MINSLMVNLCTGRLAATASSTGNAVNVRSKTEQLVEIVAV